MEAVEPLTSGGRRGATQIKLMASGGIISPTDPFDSLQLSHEEIVVAVEVARGWGSYVMAHCHTSAALEMAVEAGIGDQAREDEGDIHDALEI